VARAKEIRDAFHIANQSQIDKTLEAMCHSGDVMAVAIEGLRDTYYALSETLESVPETVPESAHILSPFDNLTIQRDRMERLFDSPTLSSAICPKPSANTATSYSPSCGATNSSVGLTPRPSERPRLCSSRCFGLSRHSQRLPMPSPLSPMRWPVSRGSTAA